MRLKLLSVTLFIIAFIGLQGCNITSDSTNSSSTKTVTLHHFGFDFSTGETAATGATITTSDGDTIGWSPTYAYISGEASNSGVWFRPSEQDPNSAVIYVKDMGDVELSGITQVFDNWPASTAAIAALVTGHVYVAKLPDGYVKFKVTEIVGGVTWEVKVEYVYSATASF